MLYLFPDGVGHIHMKDDIVMDVELQMEHLSGIIELVGTKQTPFVVTAGTNVTITKEARINAIMIEHMSPMYGSAVVVTNLAYRIIADFFIKVQRPKNPYKVFTSEKEAYTWCKQFATPVK